MVEKRRKRGSLCAAKQVSLQKSCTVRARWLAKGVGFHKVQYTFFRKGALRERKQVGHLQQDGFLIVLEIACVTLPCGGSQKKRVAPGHVDENKRIDDDGWHCASSKRF
jgi:hypothetical protein